jgi:hypothetical protein
LPVARSPLIRVEVDQAASRRATLTPNWGICQENIYANRN